MDESVIITMSVKEFRLIIREEVEAAIARQPVNKYELPVLLTREEVMDLMHISAPTFSKYMKMPGFPIFREGKILIETEALLTWVRKNSGN